MFLSGLKCLSRLERQVKFAKNRCCKIKPVAVYSRFLLFRGVCFIAALTSLMQSEPRGKEKIVLDVTRITRLYRHHIISSSEIF